MEPNPPPFVQAAMNESVACLGLSSNSYICEPVLSDLTPATHFATVAGDPTMYDFGLSFEVRAHAGSDTYTLNFRGYRSCNSHIAAGNVALLPSKLDANGAKTSRRTGTTHPLPPHLAS